MIENLFKKKIKKPIFISELSSNHNGSISNAKKIIKFSKKYGADYIKLQTYSPETITLNSKKKDFLLKKGEWKDVIMTYGTVGIKEEVDMDQATLSFNYTILDPATHTIDELNKDEVFKDYLGDVLRYIIMDSLEWGKENNLARIGIGNDESTTDSDT